MTPSIPGNSIGGGGGQKLGSCVIVVRVATRFGSKKFVPQKSYRTFSDIFWQQNFVRPELIKEWVRPRMKFSTNLIVINLDWSKIKNKFNVGNVG